MDQPNEQKGGNALTFANMSDVFLADLICHEVSQAILGSAGGFRWDNAEKCWSSAEQEIRFLGMVVRVASIGIAFAYVIDQWGRTRIIEAAIPVMSLRNDGANKVAVDIAKYVSGEIGLVLAELRSK